MYGVKINGILEDEVNNKFYIKTNQKVNNFYEIPESLADEIIGMRAVFGDSEEWTKFESAVLTDVIGKAIIDKFAQDGIHFDAIYLG